MTRRFQFSVKWLFVAILVVAAFFGGVRFGMRLGERREKQRRADEELVQAAVAVYHDHYTSAITQAVQELRSQRHAPAQEIDRQTD